MTIQGYSPTLLRPPLRAPFAPAPAEPQDSVHVASPREVALLPGFDPVVAGTMVMAAMVAGMGGVSTAALAPTLVATLGERRAEISYSFTSLGMFSQGTLGEPDAPKDVSESFLQMSDDKARLAGTIGPWAEKLEVTPAESGLRLSGTVGEVAVDVTYGLGSGGDQERGSLGWASVHGLIGGQSYDVEATLAPGRNGELGGFQVTGQLGGQPITKTYTATAVNGASGVVLEGAGELAGAPQAIRLEMNLAPDRFLSR